MASKVVVKFKYWGGLGNVEYGHVEYVLYNTNEQSMLNKQLV